MPKYVSYYSPKQYTIFEKTVDAREANYSDYPESLLPEIKEYLHTSGIRQLYIHQAEMYEAATRGENVVITTSTASGKTLGFLMPVLQEILKNPSARAIFIYPTKALASDQMRALVSFLEYFGTSRISAGVYDGDTPPNERSRIRHSANIILTNPDMFSSSFLPNHSDTGFSYMFRNLKYVVVDELHTYRGAFGSHIANVFRRFGRVCRYYQSSPQYLCSSATIANPVELAENVCGRPFTLIDRDGSSAPVKHYHFLQPPYSKNGKMSCQQITAELIPELIVDQHSLIAFCKSRRLVEIILRESRERLKTIERGVLGYSDLISGYRAGYKASERKSIERKMAAGELKGLVSTNALELGIDIGKVDTTILTGFPGTRASFWQQSGRAGRSGHESDTWLVLDDAPLDQYLAIEPEWLFATSSENAVIDQNNLYIQIAHVRAAAAELPLTLDDSAIFPNLGEIAMILINANELKNVKGKFVWCGKSYPAGDFNLRNMDNERYKLINRATSEQLAEFDEIQAFREIHKDAIYMHDGQLFHILNLDLESKTAYAEPTDVNYYTVPERVKEITIIKVHREEAFQRSRKSFGDINVEIIIGMYKKLQFHNHNNIGYEMINPLSKAFDTEGVWIDIPKNVIDVYDHCFPQRETERRLVNYRGGYYCGLCFALHNAAMAHTMTTNGDVDAVVIKPEDCESRQLSICIYDLFTGGMGYAERTYEMMIKVIEHAVTMVSGCMCENGCPACVGNYNLDKRLVMWGLQNLLEETEAPGDVRIPPRPEATHITKQFSLDTLTENWEAFKKLIAATGETNSLFLAQSVSGIRVDGSKLVLLIENALVLLQAQEGQNARDIQNIMKAYIDVPLDFKLEFELARQANSDVLDKLARHYNTLTEK